MKIVRAMAGRVAACMMLAAGTGAARAEVVATTATGFLSTFEARVARPPAEVFNQVARIGEWWAPDATYSGDAAHLGLELRAGGCWCERWALGAVEHGRVTALIPGRLLRLSSAIGPLQGLPVTGVLTIETRAEAGGTLLLLRYHAGGDGAAGQAGVARAVDTVLGEQFSRLVASLASAP